MFDYSKEGTNPKCLFFGFGRLSLSRARDETRRDKMVDSNANRSIALLGD